VEERAGEEWAVVVRQVERRRVRSRKRSGVLVICSLTDYNGQIGGNLIVR